MKKLFKNTMFSLGLLSMLMGGLSLLNVGSTKLVKADNAYESVTLSDCYYSGSDYQNASNGTGLSVDNDLNHWGKYDWTQNENTIDLHFNAVVGTAESEYYTYLGNKQNEGGCVFLVQFQAAGLMTYVYNGTINNAFRWDSLGFTGTTNEYYLHFNVVFDVANAKCNATVEAVNLTRNSANVKTRSVTDIALNTFDNTYTYVRLYRRGSTHDITLYDHWNKITFADDNGNTVRKVDRNSAIGTLPTPVGRSGASFLGWYDENGNEVTASTVSLRSMTVTAKYSTPRPFKGVTLRDVGFTDEVTLTGNGANIYGNYDVFEATSENRLDFSFNIKFNDCVDNYAASHGPALDIHFPNNMNDGTPKSRIYFGKNYLAAYLCQGSWDGFTVDYSIKFNDTDTFLINFVVEIDGTSITMLLSATNLTTYASGSVSRTFTMTTVPPANHTKIRISNISDNGGVKATLTNAWDVPTTQYIKYVNGDATSIAVVEKNAALGAEDVIATDTASQLFYRYEDESDNPVREGFVVDRDITLTAKYLDKTANGYAKHFVEKYMKPAIGTDVQGTGECVSEDWYNDAMIAFNALSEEARDEFLNNAEFSDMRARLAAWAAANGDEINNNRLVGRANPMLLASDDNATVTMIALFSCAILAVGGCFFLAKRKEK